MVENGQQVQAAPECKFGEGWVYHEGFCYLFTSYHCDFMKAEEICNSHGAYLADILTAKENDFIKSVLNVINPKDGTDYFISGIDINRDKQMYWLTGNPMEFKNFVQNEPAGRPYAHMDFDLKFAWNTKDDANDRDNGFICKRKA